MLDQSFSEKNFYNIIDLENRKGNNIEKKYFYDEVYISYKEKVAPINDKIFTSLKNFIRYDLIKKRKPSKEVYRRYKKYLKTKKKLLKKEKEKKLLNALSKISKEVQSPNFKLQINQSEFNGKKIYSIDEPPEQFFALKQLQQNFQTLYGVKQSNRFEIVNQIKCILNDKFPKIIIRTDIKSFYESIPNDKLIKQLNSDSLLSPKSKELIRGIIRSYIDLSSNENLGIPRGIGISAFLAEYYMRRVDERIQKLPNVIYYARYVDDIFVIFIPSIKKNSQNYLNQIKNIIESDDFGFTMNSAKTESIDVSTSSDKVKVNNNDENSPYYINYLGYSFGIENAVNKKKSKIGEIDIALTESKIDRYKRRIKASFDIYYRYKNETKGFRHLKSRLKFLTGNTRLVNNKSNVYVGIYFSNMLITNPQESLKELDVFINKCIDEMGEDNVRRKNTLRKYSFIDGFVNRKFYIFESSELENITKIWKSI